MPHVEGNRGRRTELAQIEMRGKRKSPRKNCKCNCLVATTATIILLSILSLGFTLLIILKTWFFGVTVKHGTLCLNVTEYKNFEIPEYTLSKDIRNNSFMYCASSRSQIEALLKWITEVKSKEKGHLSLKSSLFENHPVFAHVIVGPSENVRREKKNRGEVFLHTDHPLTSIKGIKTGEHRLIVEKTGTYYVYSKVYFRISLDSMQSSASHTVRRNNYEKYNLIFENENIIRHKRFYRTSYLSGIFNLDEGDEVFMCVQNYSQIAYEMGSNFVGMFLLE